MLPLAQHPFAQLNREPAKCRKGPEDPSVLCGFYPHGTHHADRHGIDPALPDCIDQPTIEQHWSVEQHGSPRRLTDLYRPYQNQQDVADRASATDQRRVRLEVQDRQPAQERRCGELIDGWESIGIATINVTTGRRLSHAITAPQVVRSLCANTRTCKPTSGRPDEWSFPHA